METNVFGPIKVIQAILPRLRNQGSGTIINISSVTGLRAVPTNSPYSASKHALEAYSESLSLEVAPFGIRVLVVEPGAFRTNFLGSGGVSMQSLGEAYKGTMVEDIYNHFSTADQKQPGAPDKAAQRIVEAVGMSGMMKNKKQMLRLPLGSDCLKMLGGQVDTLRNTLDEFCDVARSTDA